MRYFIILLSLAMLSAIAMRYMYSRSLEARESEVASASRLIAGPSVPISDKISALLMLDAGDREMQIKRVATACQSDQSLVAQLALLLSDPDGDRLRMAVLVASSVVDPVIEVEMRRLSVAGTTEYIRTIAGEYVQRVQGRLPVRPAPPPQPAIKDIRILGCVLPSAPRTAGA